MLPDEHYMKLAFSQAENAFAAGEVPVGAVLVMNDTVVARSHNQVELLADSTAHAEILSLTAAFSSMRAKYLPDATLFVTVEPCLMCSGALYWSKIGRIVYGAPDEKNGYRRFTGGNNPFHPKTELITGVMAEECADLMRRFFRERR